MPLPSVPLYASLEVVGVVRTVVYMLCSLANWYPMCEGDMQSSYMIVSFSIENLTRAVAAFQT